MTPKAWLPLLKLREKAMMKAIDGKQMCLNLHSYLPHVASVTVIVVFAVHSIMQQFFCTSYAAVGLRRAASVPRTKAHEVLDKY